MIDKQGYIFDLDGTLALSQHFHYVAYNIVLKEEGIMYTREEDLALYAGQGSEKIFPAVFKKNGRRITAKKTLQLVHRKREAYQELIENEPIKSVKGIIQYLEKLQKQKKKIIIATGNRRNPTEIILRKTGLQHFFPKILTIEDSKKPKPGPDIFLLALTELQLESNQCIIFEDAVNGIQAALASGIECIGVATNVSEKKLKAAGAVKVIQDYTELL